MLQRLADLLGLRPGSDRPLARVSPAGGASGAGRRDAPRDAPARTESSVTRLSATGRFIAALLRPDPAPPLAGTIRTSAPLLTEPPENAAAVAVRLRDALTRSGLFYESHQAQWVAGELPLARLEREPQARVTPLPPAPPREEGAAPRGEHPGNDEAGMTEAGTNDGAPLPVHASLLNIVKQQFEVLDTRHLTWHGAIWPGQPLYWEVTDEPPGDSAEPAAREWRTRLRLTLPRLGEVSATLRIGAAGLGVALTASESGTLDAMAAQAAALRQALAEAGVGAAALAIARAGAGDE